MEDFITPLPPFRTQNFLRLAPEPSVPHSSPEKTGAGKERCPLPTGQWLRLLPEVSAPALAPCEVQSTEGGVDENGNSESEKEDNPDSKSTNEKSTTSGACSKAKDLGKDTKNGGGKKRVNFDGSADWKGRKKPSEETEAEEIDDDEEEGGCLITVHAVM